MIVGILLAIAVIPKDYYLPKINHYLQSEFDPRFQIGDIRLKRIGINSDVEFMIQDVALKDSHYTIHHIKTLEIHQASLTLNIASILFQKFSIKKIVVDNASFNLFHLMNGMNNEYLFRSKSTKEIKLTKQLEIIERVIVNNSNINIDQEYIQKHFEFYIHQLDIFPSENKRRRTKKMNLDFTFKHLVFKTVNGSFMKHARVQASPEVFISDSTISFPKTDFKINNTPYRIATIFGIQNDFDTVDLRFESDRIVYKNTIKLLSPNLDLLLSQMNFDKPIRANASIVGHFKDLQPKIFVNYFFENHAAQLPYIDFDSVNIKGIFVNYIDKTQLPDDKNSIISIVSFKGTNRYTTLISDEIKIHNMINPSITASYNAYGDVKGLERLIPASEAKLISGTYHIKGNVLKNNLDITIQKLLAGSGRFQIINIKAWAPKYSYWIRNLNSKGQYNADIIDAAWLSFDVTTDADKIHKLEFKSHFTQMDIIQNFRIRSIFFVRSHPEIFDQFTHKFHYVPKNGIMQFEGEFDDDLDFDIDHMPNIVGKLNINDVDIRLSNYPIKLIKTNGEMLINRSRAQLTHFSTNLIERKDHDIANALHFTSKNSLVELSSQPIVHSKFDIKSKMNLFNSFLKKKDMELDQGSIAIQGDYNGIIKGTFENLERLQSKIILKDVSLYFSAINLQLKNLNGELDQHHWNMEMKNLNANYRQFKIKLALKSKDLLAFWLEKSNSTKTDLSIYAPKFDYKTIESIQKELSNNQMKDTNSFLRKYSSYNHISGNVFIRFDTLNYNQHLIQNLDLVLNKYDKYTILNKCKFNLDSGTGDILGSMELKDTISKMYSSLNFSNVSLQYIHPKISHLLPPNFQNVKLKGQIHIHSDAEFDIDLDDQYIENSLQASSTITVNQLGIHRLNSVFPNSYRPFVFWLRHVSASPFVLNLKTIQDATTIDKTFIQSNIADFWIDGNANLTGNYKLKIYVPFSNFKYLLTRRMTMKDSFSEVKNSINFELKK